MFCEDGGSPSSPGGLLCECSGVSGKVSHESVEGRPSCSVSPAEGAAKARPAGSLRLRARLGEAKVDTPGVLKCVLARSAGHSAYRLLPGCGQCPDKTRCWAWGPQHGTPALQLQSPLRGSLSLPGLRTELGGRSSGQQRVPPSLRRPRETRFDPEGRFQRGGLRWAALTILTREGGATGSPYVSQFVSQAGSRGA